MNSSTLKWSSLSVSACSRPIYSQKWIFQALKFWPQVTFTQIERHPLTGPTDVVLPPWVSGNFCALLHMCSVPLCLLQVSFTNMNLGHKYCAWCPFHSTNYFVCTWSISASRGVMIQYIQDLIQITIHRTFYSFYWLLYWKRQSNLSGISVWFHFRSQRGKPHLVICVVVTICCTDFALINISPSQEKVHVLHFY